MSFLTGNALGNCACGCVACDVQAAYAIMPWIFIPPFTETDKTKFHKTLYLEVVEEWEFLLPDGITATWPWGDTQPGLPLKFKKTTTVDRYTGVATYTYDPPLGAYADSASGTAGTSCPWCIGGNSWGSWIWYWPSYSWGIPYASYYPAFPSNGLGSDWGNPISTGKEDLHYWNHYEWWKYDAYLSSPITYAERAADLNTLLALISLLSPSTLYTITDTGQVVSLGYKNDALPTGADARVRSLVASMPIWGGAGLYVGSGATIGFYDNVGVLIDYYSTAPDFTVPAWRLMNTTNEDYKIAAGEDSTNGIDFTPTKPVGLSGGMAANALLCIGDKFWNEGNFRLDLDFFGYGTTAPKGNQSIMSVKTAFKCDKRITSFKVADFDPNTDQLVWHDADGYPYAGEFLFTPADAPAGGMRIMFVGSQQTITQSAGQPNISAGDNTPQIL